MPVFLYMCVMALVAIALIAPMQDDLTDLTIKMGI